MTDTHTAKAQTTCGHTSFHATVNVNRLKPEDKSDVDHYMAEVTIHCTQCGVPFEFVGLPAGVIMDGAAVSADRAQLRAAIVPRFRFPSA